MAKTLFDTLGKRLAGMERRLHNNTIIQDYAP